MRTPTINDIRIATGIFNLGGFNDLRTFGRRIKVWSQMDESTIRNAVSKLNDEFGANLEVFGKVWSPGTQVFYFVEKGSKCPNRKRKSLKGW